MSYESKKNAHLYRHLEAFFYKTEWACQINPIDVNFHLQKSFEFFDKNSATKNLVQKGQGVESALPHPN